MSAALNPGDIVDGRYVVERLLGQGGMGAVYVAHEEQLGRRVAIKVLLTEVMSRPEIVARFEREARAAASLHSDHVTRVFGVGRLASGSPFIAMELLEGEDLANELARRGPLPPGEVVQIMLQACEALSEAHARGIVHRDLKPANLFLARRPNGARTLKVLDFGISKVNEAVYEKNLTASSAIMGTPSYMSPEQLREARNVDGRADVWALGVTMYELLTARLPFNAEALGDLLVKVVTEPHPPIASLRHDVPPALASIVERCLCKEPSQRFSADALGAALGDLARQLPSHGAPSFSQPPRPALPPPNAAPAPVRPNTARTAAAMAPTAATFEPVSSSPVSLPTTKTLGLVVALLAVVLFGGAAAAAVYWRSSSAAKETTLDASPAGLVASSSAPSSTVAIEAPRVVEPVTDPRPLKPPPAAPRTSPSHAATKSLTSAAPSTTMVRTHPPPSTLPAGDGPPPIPLQRR